MKTKSINNFIFARNVLKLLLFINRKRKQYDDNSNAQIHTMLENMMTWKADLDNGMSAISNSINTVIKTELTNLSSRTTDMQVELSNLRADYVKFESTLSNLQRQQTETNATITEIKYSLEFQSSSHADMKQRVDALEITTSTLHKSDAICYLQQQLSSLRLDKAAHQQRERIQNLEIIGVPELKTENLVDVVMKLAAHAGVSLTHAHVEHAHRVQPRQPVAGRPRVIVAKLSSRIYKDAIISGLRRRRGVTTEDLGMPGEQRRIYVNEHLTSENKSLLRKAKETAKAKHYQFAWIKNCQIFVRKSETSPAHLIRSEDDLRKMS